MMVHDKIRWAIKQRGWSIGYFRKRIGVSFERICEIEGGKPVKMSELVKIAEALNRDVGFFLNDDDPQAEIFLHCKDICSGCRQDETTCKDA